MFLSIILRRQSIDLAELRMPDEQQHQGVCFAFLSAGVSDASSASVIAVPPSATSRRVLCRSLNSCSQVTHSVALRPVQSACFASSDTNFDERTCFIIRAGLICPYYLAKIKRSCRSSPLIRNSVATLFFALSSDGGSEPPPAVIRVWSVSRRTARSSKKPITSFRLLLGDAGLPRAISS